MYTLFNRNIIQNGVPAVQQLSEFIGIYHKSGDTMKIKPFKNTHENTQPEWWDNDCQLLKSYKFNMLRKFRFSNNNLDSIAYKRAKNRFKNTCHSKRSKLEKSKRKELLNASKNPKQYWRLIKQNCNKKINLSDQISTDEWLNYFKGLFNLTEINQHEDVLRNITQDHESEALDIPISDQEIIISTKSIHTNRPPGPDGVCIEMLKETLTTILPYLKVLFNDIFNSGIYPEDWGESILCPIYKNGNKTSPENYRGISLISSLCKIFNGILTKRLQSLCDDNQVIDESQAGFRKNYSTIDNIFSLQSVVQKYLSREGGRFYCIFIDFRRAFDSINHEKLWDSLKRKGINSEGKFIKIFQSMYRKLKSCVKVNEGLTEYFECNIGTR